MIVVDLNCENLQYDVHALINAFYADEQITVLTPETGQKKKEALTEPSIYVTVLDTVAQVVVKGDAIPNPDGALAGVDAAVSGVDAVLSAKEKHQLQFIWQYTPLERQSADWKKHFKNFLYNVFSQVLDRQLPWGSLTGIRPTKISMGLLEDGKTDAEILTYLKSEYLVSDEKAELCLDISKREKQILSGIHYRDGYSLYVGIPFCPTTCLYCSFTSYPIRVFETKVDRYVDCLIREMQVVAEQMKGRILDSVYIGGGTPTTLSADQMDRLITKLKECFDFSTVIEFTVEAGRADSITREKLEVLHRHGVGRISVNPQTMNDETLRLIGRRHTVAQVKEAFALAREVGFANINMDLILGLPGENAKDVEETIRQIRALGPDSLTVHSLAVKRASKLGAWIEENDISMLKNTDETMEIARRGALEMGMKPYYLYRQKNMAGNFENVGYATEGNFGIYNILIMEEVQSIIALGAGAISKRVFEDGRIERVENVKDVTLYMDKIDEMIERKRRFLLSAK
ncbi:MAG: coproporphyrinogen dehydrogenase HemZ [Lachnospiraceae bacterium]|nr:coproporphyrinogen dehydrogenase HemZ [Lachnospiraceae bacterium]